MKAFSYDSFTELYYRMLCFAIEQEKNNIITNSRSGEVYNLGQAYFSINSDGFKMPLLPKRGFNPFFAFAEFSWFIRGDNSLLPLQKILSSYSQYSDDQKTLNGAYGERLRKYFDFDQIERTIEILEKDSTSRRAVLQLWSPSDLGKDSRDIPCNTEIMLKIIKNKLCITIINRSNDLFKGVPYNVFIFFMLQKYISQRLKCGVGLQSHFTDNLHVYLSDMKKIKNIVKASSNLNFNKINNLVRYFSWDNIINNQEVLDFFSNIPYKITDDKFFYDERNIFYFDKTHCFLHDEFIKISSSPLKLVSLLWYDSFGKISDITLLFDGVFAMKNRAYFEGFRYANEDDLAKEASLFSMTDKDNLMLIKSTLKNEYVKEVNDEKLLQSIFLASVLSTVDVENIFYNTRLSIQNNFKSVCNKLKIDYNYILKLIPIVDSIINCTNE